jgi:hypothetical protein
MADACESRNGGKNLPALLPKEFQNVCQTIWLAKKWLGAETGEHRRDSLLAVCAGENHAQIGPKAPGLAKYVRTREPRQGDIQEHGSQIVCMPSQQFNRGEAIGSFQHREPFLAKHGGDRSSNGNGDPSSLMILGPVEGGLRRFKQQP